MAGSARQVTEADFGAFDLLLAMDEKNAHALRRIAPPGTEHRVRKLGQDRVPDPYYGGPTGFETAFDIVEEACERLLEDLSPP